jgi:CubicO group peptidase (beta-lactamase class C family)
MSAQTDNTFTSNGGALPDRIAHGWYDMNNDGAYEDLFLKWSRTAFSSAIGGEVWSNAEDLARWAKALFHDKIVLKQESIDQMLTFHSPCTGEEFFTSGYGLGVAKVNPEIVIGLVAFRVTSISPSRSTFLPCQLRFNKILNSGIL